MRGRVRLLSIVAIFTVILAVSAVFASGVINPSKFMLNTTRYGAGPTATPTVFVDPAIISKDYVNDLGYQIGNKFYVAINVTDMTSLFTYQLNVTWDHAILNFTKKVTYGDFLYRTTSPDKTSRTVPISGGNNASGYGWTAETILGNYAGISGAGRLVSMQFQVVGYGWTEIGISTSGNLPTTMLDSAGASIGFTTVGGWFDNRIRGDSDGNEVVSISDRGIVSDNWGSTTARFCDWDLNGVISISDRGIVSDNWGRTKP